MGREQTKRCLVSLVAAGPAPSVAGTSAGVFAPCRTRPAAWGKTLPSVIEPPEEPVNKSAAPDRAIGDRSIKTDDRDMGAALRSVYQRTVDEAVPDDLLSLLGKLD